MQTEIRCHNRDPNYGSMQEVMIESYSKVEMTTAELFGKAFEDLQERLEFKEKLMQGLTAFPIAGCITSIGLTINALVAKDVNALLWTLYSIAGTTASSLIPQLAECYGRGAGGFLDGANTITVFYNHFEDFKSDPRDYKVSQVLQSFEQIGKQACLKNTSQNPVLFYDAGKLLVLDALVKILNDYDRASDIAREWSAILTSTLDNQKPTTFWQHLGVSQPSHDAFTQFNLLREKYKPVEVATKVAEQFKFIISYGFANNQI